MRMTRRYRKTRRFARRTGAAALAAALMAALGGCGVFAGPADGEITEIEHGANGAKVEYYLPNSGDEAREVYLRRANRCEVGERIQSCAGAADLLVERGLRLADSATFQNCAEANALNKAPLRSSDPGWNPQLDEDRNDRACE